MLWSPKPCCHFNTHLQGLLRIACIQRMPGFVQKLPDGAAVLLLLHWDFRGSDLLPASSWAVQGRPASAYTLVATDSINHGTLSDMTKTVVSSTLYPKTMHDACRTTAVHFCAVYLSCLVLALASAPKPTHSGAAAAAAALHGQYHRSYSHRNVRFCGCACPHCCQRRTSLVCLDCCCWYWC